MNNKLLEEITKLFTSHTAFIRKEIRDSEERITTELKKEINDSQEDTIEALTTLYNEGYNNHEQRMQKLEKVAIQHN